MAKVTDISGDDPHEYVDLMIEVKDGQVVGCEFYGSLRPNRSSLCRSLAWCGPAAWSVARGALSWLLADSRDLKQDLKDLWQTKAKAKRISGSRII